LRTGGLLVVHAGLEASRHDSDGGPTGRRDVVDWNIRDRDERRSDNESKKRGEEHGFLLHGFQDSAPPDHRIAFTAEGCDAEMERWSRAPKDSLAIASCPDIAPRGNCPRMRVRENAETRGSRAVRPPGRRAAGANG